MNKTINFRIIYLVRTVIRVLEISAQKGSNIHNLVNSKGLKG